MASERQVAFSARIQASTGRDTPPRLLPGAQRCHMSETTAAETKLSKQGLIVLGLILFGYLLFERGLMSVLLEGDKVACLAHFGHMDCHERALAAPVALH